MQRYSFLKALRVIFNVLSKNSSMFLFLMVGIPLLILVIIGIKRNKKVNKWLFVIGWLYFTSFLLISFSSSLLNITDNLINDIFIQILFPNLSTYIVIILITNIIFLMSFIIKKTPKTVKIINTIVYILIMFLTILILNLINKNNINVYERLTVYSDANLLLLIETVTILFCLWIIVFLLMLLIRKIIIDNDKKLNYNDDEEIETLEI